MHSCLLVDTENHQGSIRWHEVLGPLLDMTDMLFWSGGGSIKRHEVLRGENFENCCKHHEILRGENLDLGPSNDISFFGYMKEHEMVKNGQNLVRSIA